MEKVFITTDNNGHNYVIPLALKKEFFKELENGETDEFEVFNEKFSKYNTNGDYNNVQLYAEV